jgi:hypothetical protein
MSFENRVKKMEKNPTKGLSMNFESEEKIKNDLIEIYQKIIDDFKNNSSKNKIDMNWKMEHGEEVNKYRYFFDIPKTQIYFKFINGGQGGEFVYCHHEKMDNYLLNNVFTQDFIILFNEIKLKLK